MEKKNEIVLNILEPYINFLKKLYSELLKEKIEDFEYENNLKLYLLTEFNSEEIYKNIYANYVFSYLQDQNAYEYQKLVEEYGEEEAKKMWELQTEKNKPKKRGRKKKKRKDLDLEENLEENKEEKTLDDIISDISLELFKDEDIT